jgi:23S rRNA pseudouridine1911/1915/1917 synthase
MALEILYEDDTIIVVNKAANVETQGPRSLVSLLDTFLKSRRPPEKVYACHRLDKETSGVIVFAKDPRSQKIIMDQFRQGEVKKRYYAIIEGCPARPQACRYIKMLLPNTRL